MIPNQVAAISIVDEDEFCEKSTNGVRCTNSRIYKTVAENLQYSMQSETVNNDILFQSSDDLLSAIKNLFPQIPQWKSTTVGYNTLQEWEGYVIDINKDGFTARIMDLTNRDVKEEEAEFELNDLSDDDKRRLRIGAIFRWSIGYHISAGGSKQRYSRIIFRNMPVWSERELKKNEKLAVELSRKLVENEYCGA